MFVSIPTPLRLRSIFNNLKTKGYRRHYFAALEYDVSFNLTFGFSIY